MYSATILCKINSHAVEPEFEYDDMVFVDTYDVRPSPAGVFAFWDGVGMVFARLQTVPGVEPQVRIMAKGQDDEVVPLSSLSIIGRVKGRIHRN